MDPIFITFALVIILVEPLIHFWPSKAPFCVGPSLFVYSAYLPYLLNTLLYLCQPCKALPRVLLKSYRLIKLNSYNFEHISFEAFRVVSSMEEIKVVGNFGKTNNFLRNTIYKFDVKQSLETFSQIGLISVRGFSLLRFRRAFISFTSMKMVWSCWEYFIKYIKCNSTP